MTADRWIPIALPADLPPREGRVVQLGRGEIAVFNLGDRFFATDTRCPHTGGPLCDGIVTGHAVVCPLHAWKVNLESGEVERPAGANGCVQTSPMRVQDGMLEINIGGFRCPAEGSTPQGAVA